MLIDVHAHALREEFLFGLTKAPVAGFTAERDGKGGYRVTRPGEAHHTLDPHLHNLERRMESLTRRDVGLQLFGPSPGFLSWQGGATSVELARALNAQARLLADEAGPVMEPLAVAPLGAPGEAVAELERAVKDMGSRGVMLPSSAGTRPLDDPGFADLFAFIEREGLIVFLHPTSAFPTDRFGINGMNVLLGWPFETTLSVTRMLFSGVFERHPDLKLILAHGGGNLVFLRGRLDAAYEAKGWEAHPYYTDNITRPPTDYLDRLYYDTCALSADSVAFLIDTMGSERVVFGSDFPFDVGDPEGERALPALEMLDPETRATIEHRNMQRLLAGSHR